MNERIKKIEEILWKFSEDVAIMKLENDKRAIENEKRASQSEKSMQELRNVMKKMWKRLDGMWYTEWQISEEMFSENFEMILNEWWEEIGKVLSNKISYDENNKKIAEFDIIWVNGTKVFLWEVKTKLTKKHIDKFLEKTLPKFSDYVKTQKYRWLKIFWIIWARTFESKQTKKYAIDKWLYLMTQNNYWATKILKESIEGAVSFW